MREIQAEVTRASDALAHVAAHVFDERALRQSTDEELVSMLTTVAEVVRRAEAVLVAATAEVSSRSPKTASKEDRLTVRYGCASVNELVRRCTRMSRRTVAAVERAAGATAIECSLMTGEALPAKLPNLRDALRDGETGVDGIDAVARPVAELDERIGSEARHSADAHLAAVARGDSDSGEPPACAETLRAVANALGLYFDPDGAEPRERVAMRRRGLTLTPVGDGVVRLHGHLMPETAGQLQRLFDSILNPAARPEFRPTGSTGPRAVLERHGADPSEHDAPDAPGSEAPLDGPSDDRTPAQRRHDAFAAAIAAASGSGDFPLLGGAAPTLVVTVRERDLVANRGHASTEGSDHPVSLSAARHVACTGAVQRVVQNDAGKIVRLETRERVFNAHQRRAIIARDGGCIIPGCQTPASWCEIHHVAEHALGGATHTDNGVAICFHHHRTLDVNGWRIRMRDGVPQVLAPPWWDPQRRWRTVTKVPPRAMGSPPPGAEPDVA